MLLQHGDMEDGASWVTNFTDDLPFHLQLYDAGYDVYIGNNRGTMYSWGHKTLDAATDPEYWDWTWAQMGMNDDMANIKAIKSKSGVEKIFYVGYSQGTIQMHYGLAHNEAELSKHLHKVVQLAPCFIANVPDFTMDFANSTIMQFQSKGIYSLNGPNWDENLKKICDNFPGTMCTYYTKQTGE